MRKIVIISIAFVFALNCAVAQEENKEKKVRTTLPEILPQKGDIAIGLDAANFVKTIFNSISNLPNGNTVTAPQHSTAFSSDFLGKYFLSEKSALRARLGIEIYNYKDRVFVRDDAAYLLNPLLTDPLLEKKTVDVWKQRYTRLELGIGYECRRSLWRVQGYVGGEIFGGMILNKNRYEYGNPMTDANQQPTIGYATATSNGGYRTLESKANGITCGAAVYFGADLFICRNLSIGAEFNLDGRYTRWGEESAKSETWLLQQAYVAEERSKPAWSYFNVIPDGRLNLMIYF